MTDGVEDLIDYLLPEEREELDENLIALGAIDEVRASLPRLHTGQLRWRKQIADEGARFGIVMCGRQWGKTTDAVEWLADGALNGEPVGLFSPTYKYIAEPWADLVKRLATITTRVNQTERRIELQNGGIVDGWTMDTADPGRGRKYKRVVIDEAGIQARLLEIWEAAIYPTLVRYGGSARLYGTPKGRQHGFVQLFAKGEQREGGWTSFRAPTSDNPFIAQREIELARQTLPPGVFAQEFEGIPADDGGNPFGLDAIAACVQPISPESPAVWGWDFARAQDWTVGVALDHAGRVCRLERWQSVPWSVTYDRVLATTGKQVQCVGDSTGIGDVIVETLQSRGILLAAYHFSQSSKQKLMERLVSAIQNRNVTFPDGPIRSELETFNFEYTANGCRYSAPEGLHDDCVMALGLAVWAYDRVRPTLAAQLVPFDTANRDPHDWQSFVGVPVPGVPPIPGQGPLTRFQGHIPRGDYDDGPGTEGFDSQLGAGW